MPVSRSSITERKRRERPQLAFLDDVGQWIAAGLVLYTLGISALAFNGSPIPESMNQMTQAHHTAGIASVVMAMLSFTTGYIEHHHKTILLTGLTGALLQMIGTSSNAECCLNLIALFRPNSDGVGPSFSDWLFNLSPVLGNCLLWFAYSANRRARIHSDRN